VVHRLSITVLAENGVSTGGLLGEHGLSVWIEADGRRILFDTGQGRVLKHNARVLGVSLATVQEIVLSHGHYDHTGGLRREIPHFWYARVHAHKSAFRRRFSRTPAGDVRPVGSPIDSADWLAAHVREVCPVEGPAEIAPGVRVTGEIPRRTAFENTGGDFFLDECCTEADGLADDQALFAQTPRGTVVVLGCAHAGVVNTLEYIRTLTGNAAICAVLGGMHLLNADESRMSATVRALRDMNVQRLGLAHCTGLAAMARLYHEFPQNCFPCTTGIRVAFN
jgi:7,8-dihydropterin-6-yl-methyl-4-(beta-D-ribofuranosyl)aminobenzene 5'-phosphate synthase